MAYDEYDRRVDSLVVETVTHWDPEFANIPQEDRAWLARSLHAEPHQAAKIHYERAHTGFSREITVTVADLERLYREKIES